MQRVCVFSTYTLLNSFILAHEREHTWSAARKQEIFKSFKDRHLAAVSWLPFTYPSVLPAVVLSVWFLLLFDCPFTSFVCAALWGVTGLWPRLRVEVERPVITVRKAQLQKWAHIHWSCCCCCSATEKHPNWRLLSFWYVKITQSCQGCMLQGRVQEVSKSVTGFLCVFVPPLRGGNLVFDIALPPCERFTNGDTRKTRISTKSVCTQEMIRYTVRKCVRWYNDGELVSVHL